MWVLILISVFSLALGMQPSGGEVWWWELGNGLGFLGLAWLLILVSNGRNKLGQSDGHRWLGIAVLTVIALHVAWFLVIDSVTIEYLLPGAPHYMTAGLFSFGLVLLLGVTSLARMRNRSYTKYRSFRRWHRWLSLITILFAVLHIGLSGFYFQSYWQWVGMGALLLLCYFFPSLLQNGSSFQRRALTISSMVVLLLFVMLRSQTTGVAA